MKKRKIIIRKTISFILGLLLVLQSIVPSALFITQVHAQTVTPTEEVTPTIDPTPTIAPTITEIPTPTEEATPTLTPTIITPTPTEIIQPTETGPPATPTPEQGQILDGATTTATPTPTTTPTPTITPEPTEHGQLAAQIFDNKSAQSVNQLNLDPGNVTSSATLVTDKADYAPTDTAIITGSGFLPNHAYSLTVSSDDPPATSTTVTVISDAKGDFLYAYQLDGNYRPNYKIEVTNSDAKIVASTTFTDTASILTLTVPAARTITRSALVPETSGVPTAGNAAVNSAIIGLTAIPVTLANTGDADSANVRINSINAGTHIQLWAKDTANNWFDINVTGWIGPAGKSIPAGSSITTDVYAISDVAGSYPLTVNLVYVAGGAAATATGTVTVTPIIYTIYSQTDFAAFDGVDSTLHANGYTLSSGITATYIAGAGTVSDPVNLTLTGYAPIVTPWFGPTWTTYNYVTIGIKLPTGFTGTTVYQTGVIRQDSPYNGVSYKMSTIGDGSTPLATSGAAVGYLDYSFAANSTNTTKDGLVKLQVIWTAGGTPEYFTIDVSNLSTRIHTQADFTAFDGVNSTLHANGYTVSSGITATYTGNNTIKLTGYAPIVTPWFGPTWTTYNYVTIGIKLPTGFSGTPSVYQTGIIRQDSPENGVSYRMSTIGDGSTPLATAGAAVGYLDYSFAANSINTKKDGLVKLMVIWNVGDAPEYFTIDINDLSLIPDTTPNAFSFTDQTNVALSTAIESNTITVAGINVSADVSVVGGEYSVNGGAYTSISGAVSVGNTVKVRHTSSASNSTAVNTTLTIGGVSDTFTSTTLALPAPYLKLMVAVINDDGGSAVPQDWAPMAYSSPTATLNSPPFGLGVGQAESGAFFNTGTYTLSEIANPAPGPAGYTASAWSCVLNGAAPVLGSSITLGLGDRATCTITNNDSDIFPPTVTNVTSTHANGTFTLGEHIPITVTFSEVVNVVGVPDLSLHTSPFGTTQLLYASGTGTNTLTFNYIVNGGTSTDLDYFATDSLGFHGSTIKDAAGNDAILTLPAPGAPGSLSFNKDIVIVKANAVIVVTPYSVTYNGSAHTATGTATGIDIFSENLNSLLNLSGTTHTNVNTYTGDTWTFAGDSRYNATSGTVTDTIGQATSVTTVTCPVSVVYNGLAQTPCSAIVTGAGGLSLAFSAVHTNNTDVGIANASYSFVGDLNHSASSDSKTFEITRAPLTVTADNQSKEFGAADPALTFTHSALAGSDTDSVFAGSLGRDPGEDVGTYAINPGTVNAGGNYDITFVPGTLTIVVTPPSGGGGGGGGAGDGLSDGRSDGLSDGRSDGMSPPTLPNVLGAFTLAYDGTGNDVLGEQTPTEASEAALTPTPTPTPQTGEVLAGQPVGQTGGKPWWPWIVIVLIFVSGLFYWWKRRKKV